MSEVVVALLEVQTAQVRERQSGCHVPGRTLPRRCTQGSLGRVHGGQDQHTIRYVAQEWDMDDGGPR